MSTLRTWGCAGIALIHLLLVVTAPATVSAQDGARSEVPGSSEISSSNDTLRAYLTLQEQVHQAQLAIDERTRQHMEQLAQKSSQALTETSLALNSRLQELEHKLSTQRSEETKLMLYVLSAFGAISFLAVVVTAYFQWRTVNRLADFSAALPLQRSIGAAEQSLAFAEPPLLRPGQIEETNARLIGAVERLEKRILELEHAAQPSLKPAEESDVKPADGSMPFPATEPVIIHAESEESTIPMDQESRIKRLLDRGQALLNEDKPEAAVEAFDAALALEPRHAEVLVKKGLALEKARKLGEAIECYDQAIAVDGNMTIAYLYKGGLCNRMERFNEALECFEKALRTQEKRSAA